MIKFLQSGSKITKYLIGGFLLLICIAMVITLIPGFSGDSFGARGAGVLAKVGDYEVTASDANNMARQMAKQQFQGRLPASLMPFLVTQAVDNLITRKALATEAQRMGLSVSEDELRQQLRRIPDLFPNGQFVGQEQYESMVQNALGVTVQDFERDMKEQMLLSKLNSVVTGSVAVSDDAVRQEYERRNTKVKFDYAVLTQEDVQKQITPTDKELRDFYDKNKDRYKNSIPEKRRAEYIMIDAAKLQSAQVTPDDLKRYYNQHVEEFRVPEQVNVRHILIKTPSPGPDGKVDQKAVDAARAKAQEILKQVKGGGNFAEIAKKVSEDEGSKQNGGSLGWIGRGRTVPEFEKAAFALDKGQVSDVVQSTFGFHIIKSDDKQTAHLKTLDEVKAQIEPVVARQKAELEAERIANNLTTSARTMGMQKAADKEGLPVQKTDLVARNASLMPGLADAIFNMGEKDPAQAVKLPNGYAVVHVIEVKPPATPTFEEAKAQVEGDFKRERAAALLVQKLQQLADRARAEHNLRAAAKQVGATVKTSELVTLSSQVPDIGQMSGPAAAIFALKSGEISAPIQTGRGGVVATLLEKQEAPAAEFDKQKDQVRETLVQQKRQDAMQVFVSNLRARMEKDGKIRINKKEMDRLSPKRGGGPVESEPGM